MAHVSLTEPALVPQHSEVASCCFTFQRRREEKFAEKPAAHFLCFWRELYCSTEEELMTLEMELLLYAPVTAETYCHLVLYQTWLITAKMFLIDSIVCFFFLRMSSAMFFYVCLMLQNWNLRGNYSTPLGIVFKLKLNFLTDFQQHCLNGSKQCWELQST